MILHGDPTSPPTAPIGLRPGHEAGMTPLAAPGKTRRTTIAQDTVGARRARRRPKWPGSRCRLAPRAVRGARWHHCWSTLVRRGGAAFWLQEGFIGGRTTRLRGRAFVKPTTLGSRSTRTAAFMSAHAQSPMLPNRTMSGAFAARPEVLRAADPPPLPPRRVSRSGSASAFRFALARLTYTYRSDRIVGASGTAGIGARARGETAGRPATADQLDAAAEGDFTPNVSDAPRRSAVECPRATWPPPTARVLRLTGGSTRTTIGGDS